jgi:hypothetical protein
MSAKKREKKEFFLFATPPGGPLPKEIKEFIKEGVELGSIDADTEPKPLGQLVSPAEVILRWARQGDWPGLAEYILHGGEITDGIREFLASVLRRETKAPNKRAKSILRLVRPGGLFQRVRLFIALVDEGVARERAIDLTADEFGVDRRTIRRDLKEGEDGIRLLIAMREAELKALKRHQRTRTESTPRR